jgi:two-component system sensor histidine kinase VicK
MLLVIDAQKIGQILMNLLTNAIKYSAEKTRILVVAIRLGDQVQISIIDKGIGIEPKQLESIFNRYYRVSSSSDRAPGMGLGLYISREIIELHGGKIWAESIAGKGSTFHIIFPIESVKAEQTLHN